MRPHPAPVPGRLPALVAATVFVLAALALPVVAVADGLRANDRDGDWLVSGRLDNAPLVPVLASLAEQTGFSLRTSSRLAPRQVSLAASHRPLTATLAALLADTEHVIEFGADGRVSTLYLFAVGEEIAEAPAGNHGAPTPDTPPTVLPPGSASAAMQAALAATVKKPSNEDVERVFRQRDEIFAAFVERYGKSLPPHLIEQARRKAHGDSKQ